MIHNISIATDDDIIQLGDGEKIYPVYIPCIFIQGNYHLGKLSKLARKDHCFRP